MCVVLHVPEPSVDETYQILLGLRERYEAHHKLRYTDEALDSAAKYSSQYISDRFLPDKVREPGAPPGSCIISVCCRCRQHNAFIVRATITQAGAQCYCCDALHPTLMFGGAGTLRMRPWAPAIILTADHRPDLVHLPPTGH